MASTNQCLASMTRLSLSNASRPSTSLIPRFLLPSVSQCRHASGGGGTRKRPEKKRKQHKEFKSWDKSDLERHSLCDAIRYLRAIEVGRPPTSVKYSLALKLKTLRNGPVIRSRIRLPHPVKSDIRIGVVCREDGPAATDARLGGAVAVGEESLFESIRAGQIPFNRLICHTDSVAELNKAGVARILGPKGLMPNMKTKTITSNVKALMRELVGADNYKEREGVVRIAVGQMGFTPQMLADNIKAFVGQVKKDIDLLEGSTTKQVDDIVLSSSNGPGFSLDGGFQPTDEKITPAHLATMM